MANIYDNLDYAIYDDILKLRLNAIIGNNTNVSNYEQIKDMLSQRKGDNVELEYADRLVNKDDLNKKIHSLNEVLNNIDKYNLPFEIAELYEEFLEYNIISHNFLLNLDTEESVNFIKKLILLYQKKSLMM